MNLKFAVLLSFLVTCFSVSGQKKQINYLEYGPEITHMYSGIVGMYQDPAGYIWLHGVGGISRYDGIHFESIQSIFPESKNIQVKNCLSLFKDDDYFWIGTRGAGLYCIDQNGKLEEFENKLISKDQLKAKVIKQIISLGDRLFILGETGLETFQKVDGRFRKIHSRENVKLIFAHKDIFWMSDGEKISAYNLVTDSVKVYSDYSRASFFSDHLGRLWFSTYENGTTLYRFDEQKDDIEKIDFQPFENTRKGLRFCFANNLELWAIESGKSDFSIVSFLDKKVIPKENIAIDLERELFLRHPFRDRNNRMWLYSNALKQIHSGDAFSSLKLNDKDDVAYTDLLVDRHLVFAGLRNSGLIKYNTITGEKQLFTTDNSQLAHNYVSRIEHLRDQKIAICQMNHFQIYDLESGFSPAVKVGGITRSVFENDTHYWVGGIRSVFKIKKGDNSVENILTPSIFANYNNAVNEIINYDEDYLILATSTNGLELLNKKTNELSALRIGTNTNVDSLQINKIIAAAVSPDKRKIAVATDNELRIVELGKSIQAINTDQYFFSNVVFQSDTVLYATSNNEVIRYSLIDGRLNRYGIHNGLINSIYSFRSNYVDNFGNVYFSGNNGIDIIKNEPIEDYNSAVNLMIEKIEFSDSTIFHPIKNKLVFSPEERHVDIKLNTPGNVEGRNIKIQENYSSQNRWTDLHESGILSLINPTPGERKISFRAIDLSGNIRSEMVNMNMEFKQHWYQNSWFWLLAVLTLLAGIFTVAFVIQDRKNKSIQAEIKFKEELTSLKMQSLTSQMNPHFIFNALSSIQQLIAEGKPEVAENYLMKFSKILRYVMQYATDETVSLKEEINFIKNYIDLEVLRFSDTFEYVINNNVLNSTEIQIPPFFIQPQVENAIKHGLRNKEGLGLITINISNIDQKLEIEIRDNGIGREAAQKINTYYLENTKKGILLTKERINHLNKKNSKASIQIIDLKDENQQATGTSVVLSFDNRLKTKEKT